MNCTICGKPLSGVLDTYGDHDAPLCWACFCEKLDYAIDALDKVLWDIGELLRKALIGKDGG